MLNNKFFSVCSFTDYEEDVGWFSDDYRIADRTLISNEACIAWCDEHPECKAAVLSPANWYHRQCFLVSTLHVTERDGWFTAVKECPGYSVRYIQELCKFVKYPLIDRGSDQNFDLLPHATRFARFLRLQNFRNYTHT